MPESPEAAVAADAPTTTKRMPWWPFVALAVAAGAVVLGGLELQRAFLADDGPGAENNSGGSASADPLATAPASDRAPWPAPVVPAFVPAAAPFEPVTEVVVAADGSGDATTLAAAMADAASGTRVRVKPGNYAGPVHVPDGVWIEGDGPRDAIVLAGRTGLLVLSGDRPDAAVLVRGLTIRATATGAGDPRLPCAALIAGRPLTMEDCVLTGDRGVLERMDAAGVLRLRRCTFHDYGTGVLASGGLTSATHCTFVDGEQAAVARDSARLAFNWCDFADHTVGAISLLDQGSGAPQAELTGCRIERAAGALALVRGSATLTDCRLSGMTTAGISLGPGTRLTAARTSIERCVGSAVLATDATATLRDCRLRDTDMMALVATGDAADVTLEACTLTLWMGAGADLGGTALLRDCRISDGAGPGATGVVARPGSTVVLERCDLLRNGGPGVTLQSGQPTQLRDCRVAHNDGAGVYVGEGGTGRASGGEIRDNRQGPVAPPERADAFARE